MYRTFVFSAFSLTLMAANLVPDDAFAQVRTELRDPIRGVSFHSVEIDDSSLAVLDVVEGNFSDSDRLVVGLSAMAFDGSDAVDGYVLWIRHEARLWPEFALENPVDVVVDGEILRLEQLRATQPFVGAAGRLFEKIEFELSETDLMRLVASSDPVITLRTGSGIVRKHLNEEELANMRLFAEEIGAELIDSRSS